MRERGQLSPVLVGRDDLLALAGRRLTSAAGGTGHLLFLAGEAGIGKTRLLHEIIRRATDLGFSVATASAFSLDADVAGGVLAELATDLQRDVRTAPVGASIARRLERDAVDGGDAHRQRRLLIGDLAAALLSLGSGITPALLTLEDLHWADDSTIEVLDRLARRLPPQRLLVVGTYRTDELYPRLPMRELRGRLLNSRLGEEVRLTRLTRLDTAAMVAAIRGSGGSAGSGVSEDSEAGDADIFDRSDGIPLHVEEFLAAGEVAPSLPQSLSDAMLTRADLLSEPSRRLADVAAVVGRSFDVDLLTTVSGRPAAEIDQGLRELADRYFIRAHPNHSTYDFRHALIRDALYADLAPLRRREIHARVAEVASSAHFGAAVVSEHYERANRPEEAYRYAMLAAAAAGAISAHREAVELYRRADRAAASTLPDAERAQMLQALAAELAVTDQNAEAALFLDRAGMLWRKLGDVESVAGAAPSVVSIGHLLGSGLTERVRILREALALLHSRESLAVARLRIRLHAALSAAYMLDRRLDEAIEHGELASAMALDLGPDADPATVCNLDATLGSVLVFAGRMTQGWQLLRQAIVGAKDAGIEAEAARGYRMLASSASVVVEYDLALDALREGIAYADRTERFNDSHYMIAHLAHVWWAVGDWAAAARHSVLALADGRGGVTTRITALHVQGFLALGAGEDDDARRHLQEAAELGARMNELQRISPAWWGMAENALLQNRFDEAAELCERGYEASAAVGDAAYLFPFVLTGTRAQLAAGDPAAAGEWVERCRPLLDGRGIAGSLGAIGHAEGLLRLQQGRTGEARALLDAAAEFWSGRRRFWEGCWADLDRSRCAARSRRPADAAALARGVRDRAAAAGATVLVRAADAMLAAAQGFGDDPGPLTARETEIASLVATGATNREIAEALTIAPKTVAAHIEHILTKLDAARRAQIATWVTTRNSGSLSPAGEGPAHRIRG